MIYSTHRLLPVLCCRVPACGARNLTRGSLGLAVRRRRWVSTEHLHAERGHARLLRSGCANSEDAGPVYPSSPKEQRGSRREDRQVDRPAPADPRNPAPSRRGDRGPAEAGPPQLPAKAHPALAVRGPTVSTRPSRRSPCGGDHRVRPAITEAPPKPAEAAIVIDLLASRGRRRVWPPSRQHGGADPGICPWGPALQERDAPQPPPRAPVTRQSSDVLSPDVRPAD